MVTNHVAEPISKEEWNAVYEAMSAIPLATLQYSYQGRWMHPNIMNFLSERVSPEVFSILIRNPWLTSSIVSYFERKLVVNQTPAIA